MNRVSSKFPLGGHFYTQIVRNGVEGPWEIDHNMVVDQGVMHFLNATLDQATQNAAYYIALFSGNVTVVSTWTAANFTASATEFTNYTESNRVLWANDAAAANSIGNDTTPAVFTIGSGGGTVRGAALISVATKSATTGTLIAASRFASDKVLAEDEELRIKYIIGGEDNS